MAKKPKLYGMRKYWPHLTEERAEAERQKMSDKQGACCAICYKPEGGFKNRLAVDHNHKTGKVRGLLCFYCNKFKVMKHTISSAKSVVEYLIKYDPDSI